MGRQRQANDALAALIDEAGLTNKGLARRVVDRGRAIGLDLAYDHNSVRRWLSGEQPNPPVTNLVAEVLTENLGYRVTPGECGLHAADVPADLGLEFELAWNGAVDTVTALWRGDVERRRFLVGSGYAVAVYPAATMRWLTLPNAEHPESNRGRRVGKPDIDAVQSMTATFRDLDNRVGGGRVRPSVVQYLHSSVSPLLRGSYTEHTGRQLFAAGSKLTRLAGWMAYDQEEHGLARYLIQALRLARTAGDTGLGAEILAAMSHQATYVGRAGDAVDLARAAQIGARKARVGALESECHLVEAHGHAARNDAAACSQSLSAAETAFDRAGDGPDWLGYFDQAYLSAKIAHCFRDLGDDRRTATYAEQSLDMADGYLRGRAFNLSVLAGSRAPEDPDEAARLGTEALHLVDGLSSQRARTYLRSLRHQLEPYRKVPAVADLRERIAGLKRA